MYDGQPIVNIVNFALWKFKIFGRPIIIRWQGVGWSDEICTSHFFPPCLRMTTMLCDRSDRNIPDLYSTLYLILARRGL